MWEYTKKRLLQYVMNRWFFPLRPLSPATEEPAMGGIPGVDELVARMTTEEKCAYIGGTAGFSIRGIPRLNLPPILMADASCGVRGADAPVTAFPSPVALAASWNKAAVHACARMIAEECRATGVAILLAPGINIARVPVCGRNFEYMGEDPFLAGEIASAYVKGVQSLGVGVTVKHFACNNGEYDRHKSNSVVDERTLRELYLPAFHAVVRSGATGVMTAYNQINGTYASEHPHLIGKILRGEWKFDGLVVSDWNSLYSTEGAFRHGVDIEMPKAKWFVPGTVADLLTRKPELAKILDNKVRTILTTASRLGALQRPAVDLAYEVGSEEHRRAASRLAAESVVLLKHGGMLPLDKNRVRKLVILGAFASGEPIGGGGSSFIKQAQPAQALLPVLGKLLPQTEISVHEGRWWMSTKKRREVAKADAVIITTGFGHILESEAYDRPWRLPDREIRNIVESCALNDNVTVIVHAGGAFEMQSWIDRPQEVLLAWYLGSEGAQGLTDLLLGKTNPTGKLPITIAKKLEDHVSMSNYPTDFSRFSIKRITVGQGNPKKRSVKALDYREALMVGYRQFDTIGPEPLYPFGHGLSYTTFSYSDLTIAKKAHAWQISWKLTNEGAVAGAEVCQLYVRPEFPDADHPMQQLRGFDKVFLQPGESSEVDMELSDEDFSEYSVTEGRWIMVRGVYTIAIGSSSRDIRLCDRLDIGIPDQRRR